MRQKDSFRVWTAIAVAALVAVALGVFYFYQREQAPESTDSVGVEAPPIATTEPPRTVVVTTPPPERTIPLPPLDESDAEVRGGLTELFGREAVQRFLVPERIVRRIVVTIDNMPRAKMALQQRPVQPTPGEFLTTGPEEALVLAPENYARYTPIVTVIGATDAKTLVALYRGLQPLFQQAYEELGHPDSFFNTRLLEVIDHLLSTPDVPAPIRLVQPGVFYKYADKDIEALSSGRKLLIRMGPENAAIIKEKLREVQAELI
ncbi:MAG TPA: DUF3014 domain-containing protein [Gammaproteobacteria bacterium]|nr:DUF3014 domain-containing protein [Gammaproteobacteria bacterium]